MQSIRDWLASHDITDVTHSDNKGWLAFDAPASTVEKLLKTEFFEHEDQVTGGVIPACDRYHVPAKIQEHIDYITPGTKLLAPVTSDSDLTQKRGEATSRRFKFGQSVNHDISPEVKSKILLNAGDLSTCDVAITPACVAALYNITSGTLASPNNSLGIFESELQFWDQKDLDLFFANFSTQIPIGTHPINEEIDGGVAQTNRTALAGGESMLDLLLAYPIVYPQTITVLNVDDLHYQTWENDTYTVSEHPALYSLITVLTTPQWGFNTLLDAIDGSYCTYSAYNETGDLPGVDPTYPDSALLGYKGSLQCGVYEPPNVISLSYGGQEADVPIAYQKRQCNEYLKLGLQGVTLAFASGDAGVGNYPSPYGFDGPTGCLGPDLNIFNPTWPNNCPWITNVGATKVYPGYTVADPESAVFDPGRVNYSSGGGFSNLYDVPSYQKQAVDLFFQDHNPAYPYYEGFSPDSGNYTLPNITELAGNTGGVYNRLGRGIPDVAANGDNIAVYVGGEFGLSGGTSASTPIFASIVRLYPECASRHPLLLGMLNTYRLTESTRNE